ncbi:MAG: RNA polymerase sigma factor [Candidatus Latescibacteria bacterium]|nr:RNA polymerase sigma factor [Candidatus Latescibacterota bacterium]
MVPLKLFEQHCRDAYPSLYRTAVWITGSRDLAEDALQEALLKGYQALATLRDLEHLGGWLHRITVREALGVLRAKKIRQTRAVAWDESLAATSADQGDEAERMEQRQAIWRGLEELSPQQRTAFILCAVEERSIHEAAEAMEISEGTVKTHLDRGRDKLRQLLVQYKESYR